MKFALITPSYAPDFERCRLLCESVDRFASPEITHYVLVDRRDETLFQQVASPRRRIITVESILPRWLFRLPGAKRWWMSLKTLPVRNWILQQIVKLSMAEVIHDADVFIYVDSDVTFVKPFGPDRFLRDDLVRLNRVHYQGADHERWLQSAADILGLPRDAPPRVNYVASLVTWRRDRLQDMYRHIERVSGKSWRRAILKHLHFSEYTIYGVFVECILGLEQAGHSPSDDPILHLSWGHDLSTQAGVDAFLATIRDEEIGIMIHSKDAVPLDRYRPAIERLWERAPT